MASVSADARQVAIRRYNELIQEQQQLAQKISEFEMDSSEYKLVEETLAPLDPGRRAYRLVGEVLVERTVEEVLPSLKKNRENIDIMVSNLRQNLQESVKESNEIKATHNLQTEQPR